MSLEKKFAAIKKLDKFQADKSWQVQTKHAIMSEIYSQTRLMRAQKLSFAEKLDLFMLRLLRRLMPSASKLVAILLIVGMSSGFSVAAQTSLPGQALYPVKRSLEKAELTLALSPVKETKVHIKHLNKRLEEIDKIVEENKIDNKSEKIVASEKAIQKVVIYLEKEAAAIDQSLKIVKAESNPLETVSLAKQVTELVKISKDKAEVLAQQIPVEKSQVIQDALDNVKVISAEVSQTAVTIAVATHAEVAQNQAENNADNIKPEDVNTVKQIVTEIITANIEDLSKDLQASQEKVETVATEVINQAVKDSQTTEVNILPVILGETPKVETKDIQELKVKSAETTTSLDAAKAFLESGSLQDAVLKINESQEAVKKTEAVLKTIDTAQKTVDAEKLNASSTKPTSVLPAKKILLPISQALATSSVERE
jgi:hypothetical protein